MHINLIEFSEAVVSDKGEYMHFLSPSHLLNGIHKCLEFWRLMAPWQY